MTENTTVTLERLSEILDAYGTRKSHWPASEKQGINALLQSSSDAQRLYQEARQFDAMLSAQKPTAPSALMGKVLQDADILLAPQTPRFRNWLRELIAPVAGLAFAACPGITVGIVNPDVAGSTDDLYLDELSVSDTVLEWGDENDNS